MTIKQKEKWIKALRSGSYTQTTDSLREEKRDELTDKPYKAYCCLGVAEVVCRAKRRDRGALKSGFLSYAVQDKLVHLNDTKRWSFKKIAAYIERYIPATV